MCAFQVLTIKQSNFSEHGVGSEKRDLMALMFSANDLQVMQRVKNIFNPDNRMNPCKVFPATKMCIEVSTRRRAAMKKPLKVGARELEGMAGLPLP